MLTFGTWFDAEVYTGLAGASIGTPRTTGKAEP